jgi:hypothetical protein
MGRYHWATYSPTLDGVERALRDLGSAFDAALLAVEEDFEHHRVRIVFRGSLPRTAREEVDICLRDVLAVGVQSEVIELSPVGESLWRLGGLS